jgi:cysteine desulfurase
MVMGLDMRGVAVSAGSACASGAVKHSHVILAMGLGKDAAGTSLRISLGLGNGPEEIRDAAERIAATAAATRGVG